MKIYFEAKRKLNDTHPSVITWLTENIGQHLDQVYAHNSTLVNLNKQRGDFDGLYGEYQSIKIDALKKPSWSYQYVDAISKHIGAGWTSMLAMHVFQNDSTWMEQWIVDVDSDMLAVQFKLAFL